MINSSPKTPNSTPQTEKDKSPNGSGPKRPGSSENPLTPTPIPELRENVLKKWAYLKLGERGFQLAKDQSRQSLVERLVKKSQDGTIGQKDGDNPSGPMSDEDMAVSVGDQFETHHHYPPPQQPAKEKDDGSALSKWALAAGLLATGLGGGALAMSMLKGDNPPAVSDDTNTKYGLKLYEGES
jgi:hypothetical protein